MTDLHDAMVERLGPTLVTAMLIGARDHLEGETRLAAADTAWLTILMVDDGDVARAWFIGMNPRLGDQSPIMAIRAGRGSDVVAAARGYAGDPMGD